MVSKAAGNTMPSTVSYCILRKQVYETRLLQTMPRSLKYLPKKLKSLQLHKSGWLFKSQHIHICVVIYIFFKDDAHQTACKWSEASHSIKAIFIYSLAILLHPFLWNYIGINNQQKIKFNITVKRCNRHKFYYISYKQMLWMAGSSTLRKTQNVFSCGHAPGHR